MKKVQQIIKAVACAMIGVGNKEDLAKDADTIESIGPMPYIIAAVIGTITFVGLVIGVVRLVLA